MTSIINVIFLNFQINEKFAFVIIFYETPIFVTQFNRCEIQTEVKSTLHLVTFFDVATYSCVVNNAPQDAFLCSNNRATGCVTRSDGTLNVSDNRIARGLCPQRARLKISFFSQNFTFYSVRHHTIKVAYYNNRLKSIKEQKREKSSFIFTIKLS